MGETARASSGACWPDREFAGFPAGAGVSLRWPIKLYPVRGLGFAQWAHGQPECPCRTWQTAPSSWFPAVRTGSRAGIGAHLRVRRQEAAPECRRTFQPARCGKRGEGPRVGILRAFRSLKGERFCPEACRYTIAHGCAAFVPQAGVGGTHSGASDPLPDPVVRFVCCVFLGCAPCMDPNGL